MLVKSSLRSAPVFLSAPGSKINAASPSSCFTGLPPGRTHTHTNAGLKAVSGRYRCLLICVIYSAAV